MDQHPDSPFRGQVSSEAQQPVNPSPRERQRHDHPTSPKTAVSQPFSTPPEVARASASSPTSSPTRYSQYFAPPSETSRGVGSTRQITKANLNYTVPNFSLGADTRLQRDIITPDHIIALVNFFEEEACTAGCIPASIFDEVRAISQDMENVPTRSRGEEDGQDHSALLNVVKDVYADAIEKFANNEDESSWYPLVFEILRYGSKRNSPITIINAQTKSICQDLLPRNLKNENKPIGTVKVDFLLHFNYEKNNEIQEALTPCIHRNGNGGNLSAFNDQRARDAFSLSVVEVKPVGGDYMEALYQLAVASAAMQQRLIQLRAGVSEDSLQHEYHQTLPVVCLVVVGHFWYFHIVYKANSDWVVSQANEALSFSDTNVPFSARVRSLPMRWDIILPRHLPPVESHQQNQAMGLRQILAIPEGDCCT